MRKLLGMNNKPVVKEDTHEPSLALWRKLGEIWTSRVCLRKSRCMNNQAAIGTGANELSVALRRKPGATLMIRV